MSSPSSTAVIVAIRPIASFTASFESALSCSSGRSRARRPPNNEMPTRARNKTTEITVMIIVGFANVRVTDFLERQLLVKSGWRQYVSAECAEVRRLFAVDFRNRVALGRLLRISRHRDENSSKEPLHRCCLVNHLSRDRQ